MVSKFHKGMPAFQHLIRWCEEKDYQCKFLHDNGSEFSAKIGYDKLLEKIIDFRLGFFQVVAYPNSPLVMTGMAFIDTTKFAPDTVVSYNGSDLMYLWRQDYKKIY